MHLLVAVGGAGGDDAHAKHCLRGGEALQAVHDPDRGLHSGVLFGVDCAVLGYIAVGLNLGCAGGVLERSEEDEGGGGGVRRMRAEEEG